MNRENHYQIVSANHLLDGDVVYFGGSGRWEKDVRAARVAHDDKAAMALLGAADGDASIVVGPYLIDVALDADGTPRPSHMREVMRETGPSVARQHF